MKVKVVTILIGLIVMLNPVIYTRLDVTLMLNDFFAKLALQSQ